MSGSQWIATIIEVLIAAAIIIGFRYEDKVAEWEQKKRY